MLELLFKVLGEVSTGEFIKACSKSGLSEEEVESIIDALFENNFGDNEEEGE
jgi:hypothetical protein